jgi:hypothetical protein
MTILTARPLESIIVDTSIAPIINLIIRNVRNPLTGIAIDYGFTSQQTKSFVRWSSAVKDPYGKWEEVPFDATMQREYDNFCNFKDVE